MESESKGSEIKPNELKMDMEIEEQKEFDISDIMETFGKYQIIQYLLICLSTMCISMISVNYVFVAQDINYRCRVNECETTNSTAKFPSWWPDPSLDRCSMPVLNTSEEFCTNNSFTGEVVPCKNWIYERSDTVVAEFNLACRPWKLDLIGTIHGFGMLVSMMALGWISDTMGRKPTIIICIVGGCIGQLKTLVTSYNIYVIIEFIEGAFTGGSYAASLIILLEVTKKKYQPWAGVIVSCAFHLGECIFAGISFFEPHWRSIIHIINTPPIFFIIYIFLVNESPRWQTVKGKVKKAKKTFKKMIKLNNININNEYLENIDDSKLREKFNVGNHSKTEGVKTILKCKELIKRFLIIFVCRFTVRLIYTGMMLNSVWLPGDKYLNFFLAVLVSFPGEIIAVYLTCKVGRKIPLMAGFSICGILSIISALIPTRYLWTKLALFFVSKMIISLCFSGIATYSMELFPTSVRGTLMGFGSFSGRSAIMLSAMTPLLNTIFDGLPLIIFGCLGILSCVLLVFTPETKDSPLLDTIEQLEIQQTTHNKIRPKGVSTIHQNTGTRINNT